MSSKFAFEFERKWGDAEDEKALSRSADGYGVAWGGTPKVDGPAGQATFLPPAATPN